MAATSPYTQNDYQAVSTFRPYQLPVNDIFKAITSQDEFWRQGALRVKSVYDNALDLKLSKEENKTIRDDYLRDAQKQLSKLSAMDLSDPSVQRQGFNLFKPLFSDEGVMSDDQATRAIQQVNDDAMRYRNTDGGKLYSSDNHQYALTGAAEFLASPDRKAGMAYLKQKKDYEPYYNYTEEYDKVIKNCPSDSDESTGILNGTGYMKSVSVKERSQSKVATCLEAGLSPKAFRQMQIEGSMRYRNHPDTLMADYADYLNTHSANSNQQMQKLSGAIEGLKTNKSLTDEEKAVATKQIQEQIDSLQNEMIKSNAIVGRLNVGDKSDLAGNEEQIAGTLYQYRKVLKESYAAAFKEQKVDFKADPVQMQRIGFQQNVQLKNLDFKNDVALRAIDHNYDMSLAEFNAQAQYNLEQLKQAGKAGSSALTVDADGNLTVAPGLQSVAAHFSTSPDGTDGLAEFGVIRDKINAANTTLNNNETTLFNSFIRRGDSDPAFRDRLSKAFNTPWETIKSNGNNFILQGGERGKFSQTAWFQNYIKQNPDDPDMRKWNNLNTSVQISAKALNLQLEQGENIVARNLGIKKTEGQSAADAVGEYLKKGLATLPSVNIGGVTVTPQEVQDGIDGKAGKVQIKHDGTTISYFVNGKPVDNTKDWLKIEGLHGKILLKNQDLNANIADQRKKVYSNQQFANESWFYHVDDKSNQVQVLEGILGYHPDGKAPVKRGIQIEQINFEGGYKARIPGLKRGGAEFEDIVKKFPTRVAPVQDPNDPEVVTFKDAGYITLPNGTSPMMKETAYVLSTISTGAEFQQAQPGQKINSGDIEFPMVDRSGNTGKIRVQIYKDVDGTPSYEVINATGNKKMNEFKDPFQVMKYLQTINTK